MICSHLFWLLVGYAGHLCLLPVLKHQLSCFPGLFLFFELSFLNLSFYQFLLFHFGLDFFELLLPLLNLFLLLNLFRLFLKLLLNQNSPLLRINTVYCLSFLISLVFHLFDRVNCFHLESFVGVNTIGHLHQLFCRYHWDNLVCDYYLLFFKVLFTVVWLCKLPLLFDLFSSWS
jgi:hypothetical protein